MKLDKLGFEIGIGIGIGYAWRYADSTARLYLKIKTQTVILRLFYIESLSIVCDLRLFFLVFYIATYGHPKFNRFL